MPVIHTVQQGSEAWRMLRAGIPTASAFDKIMTPKTRKLSSQRFAYRNHLIAERILGRYLDSFASPAMERGSALEADALSFYEMVREAETTPCGFMTTPDGRIGASPDFLVCADGCGEIKCAANYATHVGWLLGDSGIADDYLCQVQGQLWISGRQWVDTVAYHPDLPKTIVRTERDEEFVEALAANVRQFSDELEAKVEECRALGYMEMAEKERRDNQSLPPMPSLDGLVAMAAANGIAPPEASR